MLKRYLNSSVGRKQIVAITGIMLFGFLFFHMSMNLLIFAGKEWFNFFPNAAHSTGLFLRVAEAGLAAVFLTHIIFTIKLVRENRKARSHAYEVPNKKERSLSTKIMPYTGLILLVFLILHIKDFVLADHQGALSMINGESAGIYGVVVNTFKNSIVKAVWYVIAMCAVGFHLTHGIQSLFQTLGINHPNYTPIFKKAGVAVGLLFALGFSSIPIYFAFQFCCKVAS